MATVRKQSATVHISERSHRYLRELATQSGEPMGMVLGKVLEQYRRQRFWEEMNVACAALQQDAEAWKEYQDELKLWEVTLMDGLDPSEVWTEAAFVSGTKAEAVPAPNDEGWGSKSS